MRRDTGAPVPAGNRAAARASGWRGPAGQPVHDGCRWTRQRVGAAVQVDDHPSVCIWRVNPLGRDPIHRDFLDPDFRGKLDKSVGPGLSSALFLDRTIRPA